MISNHYNLVLSSPSGGPAGDPQPGDLVADMHLGTKRLGIVLEILGKGRSRVLWPDSNEYSGDNLDIQVNELIRLAEVQNPEG